MRNADKIPSPARLLVLTEQGKRVAVLPVESNTLVLSDPHLFDHAAALNYQLNTRINGNWAPGLQQSLASLNASVAGLSEQQLADGAEIEFESRVSGAATNQYAAQVTVRGLQGFSTLPGSRPARRVNNPNLSPEPAVGLAFNTNGATTQSFSIPNPALNEACLAFWMKRNTQPGTGGEYWLASARPANNFYFTADSGGSGTYVGGLLRTNSLLGSPQGQWVRVVINFPALAPGTVSLFSGNPGTGTGPVNAEVYDVRFYSRHFTDVEIAAADAAPSDSLLARYTLPFNLDTSTATVPDESGNNTLGTLYNF